MPELSRSRLAASLPFAVIGVACVIAGGLVSAVTAHAPTQPAAWAAAYLVLVGGVAQVGLGAGQAALAATAPSGRQVAAQVAAWNVGNAAVLVGTLVESTLLVDVGGLLLVAGLALLVFGVRGSRPEGQHAALGWALVAYRLLVVVLLVSIPIGLLLARS